MGKPPLFRQRRGNSAHRPGNLGRGVLVEPLEHRLMLAADATAANVFAQFQGAIDPQGSTVTIPLNFSRSNFTFSGKQAVVGVQVIAADGMNLDPAVVQIKDAHNHAVTPIFKNSNLDSKKQ